MTIKLSILYGWNSELSVLFNITVLLSSMRRVTVTVAFVNEIHVTCQWCHCDISFCGKKLYPFLSKKVTLWWVPPHMQTFHWWLFTEWKRNLATWSQKIKFCVNRLLCCLQQKVFLTASKALCFRWAFCISYTIYFCATVPFDLPGWTSVLSTMQDTWIVYLVKVYLFLGCKSFVERSSLHVWELQTSAHHWKCFALQWNALW